MVDVLSDVLIAARLGSAVLGRAHMPAPFGTQVDPRSEAAVHIVQKGGCWLRVGIDETAQRLNEGDFVLVAGAPGHRISDTPDRPCQPLEHVLAQGATTPTGTEHSGITLLCAKYQLDANGPHPLVSLLPQVIILRAADIARRPQLKLAIDLLNLESEAAEVGRDLVAPRLLDTLLVFALRAWIEDQPEGAGGWFGALRDAGVNRALRRIHAEPATPWTVESLAEAAGQSRATFARRFTALAGETPLAYVTRWRMILAGSALRDSDVPIDAIAARVGYQSAPAFSRAFQRIFGKSPGRYRVDARRPGVDPGETTAQTPQTQALLAMACALDSER